MGTEQKSMRRRITKPTRNWLELPPDVTADILHRLGVIEILENAQKVCSSWRRICKDPLMWRIIDMKYLGYLHCMPYDLEKMCKHAVDRSKGQLIDINLEGLGTSELIEYIADRSSQLRRLQIASRYALVYGGLIEAVKKLPLLEELHLTCAFTKEAIEDAGRCCPLLKSFKFNTRWYKYSNHKFTPSQCDEEALAIAKNMPQLRHLQLIGNLMTNNGLQAILDGCPHLESLDLRLCLNLNLEGSLGKRCSEQIKDLRRPNNSTKSFEFVVDDDDVSTKGC